MPKIPVQDIPQERPQIPAVNLAQMGPGASAGYEALGRGLETLADAVAQKTHEADRLRLEEQNNNMRAAGDELAMEVTKRKGQQIFQPVEGVDDPNLDLKTGSLKKYDEIRDIYAAELPERMRERFIINANRFRDELSLKIDSHTINESEKAANEAYQRVADTELNHIMNFGINEAGQPDGPVIAQSEARLIDNNRRWWAAGGKDPAIGQKEAQRAVKTMILESLVAKDSPAAETYYNLFKGELDAKTRLRLEPIIADKKNYYTAAREVPVLIEKYAIPGTNQFDINAAMLDVYSRQGMTEKLQNDFYSLLHARQQLIEKSNAVAIEANANKVIGNFTDNKSAAVATNLPEFTALRRISEAKAADLRNTLFAWEQQMMAEAQGLKDPNRWMSQNASFWVASNDTEALKNMTPQQIYDPELMIALGQTNYQKLVEKWNTLRSPESLRKLTDVVIKDEEMRDVFVNGGLGIKPKGEKKTTEWLAKKAALRELIENDIRTEQLSKKPPRQLLEPERKEIYKKWTTKIQIDKDRWFFGLIPGGKEEFYPYERPQIFAPKPPNYALSESAYQDLDRLMVERGILPALKPGEAISQERRQKIQNYLSTQVPRTIAETDIEAARQRAAVQPAPVPASIPAPAAAPAAPSRVGQTLEAAGIYKLGRFLRKIPYSITRPLMGTGRQDAEYQKAIDELVKGKVLKPLEPGKNYTNQEWDTIKAYIAERKGKGGGK